MLGRSVALGSGVALLGGPTYPDAWTARGEAVTFSEQADGTWVREQRLLPDESETCRFGQSLALRGDLAAIVAPGEGPESGGTVRIYRIIDGFLYEVFHFDLLEIDAGSLRAVATDGVRVAVSSPNEFIWGVGSLANVRIFEQGAEGWYLADVIRPPDEFWQDWGFTLALDGDLLLIGDSRGGPGGLHSPGRVSVYRDGPEEWSLEAHLLPAEITPNDWFGSSIAVSGDTVIAGATGWGDPNATFTTGAAFVFRKREEGWVEEGMLLPANSAPGQYAGETVEIEGDVAWIGTDDDPGGAIHVFRRESTCWIEEGILDSNPDEAGLALGAASLSWNEGRLLVGAPLADRAYLFEAPHPSASLDDSKPFRRLVPAVAHAPGAGGESWTSDVVLHNPQVTIADVGLFLLTEAGRGPSWPLRLAPGQTARLDDVVERKLAMGASSGAVLVASDVPIEVTSRTFNVSPGGTFGQGIPAFAADERSEWILPGAEESARRRTNFGVANSGAADVEISVELFGAGGESLGSAGFTVPAFGYLQENRIVREFGLDALAGGWLRVRSAAPTEIVPWLSVVDAGTGDAVFVAPQEPGEGPQVVGALAHAPGLAGTLWRSDLILANPGGTAVPVRIELLGAEAAAVEREVPARGQLVLEDVLETAFGRSGAAGAVVTPIGGSVAVLSRTSNVTEAGAFGQSIPGWVPGSAASEVRLVGLAHDPSGTTGYRTNLGFANPAAAPAAATVDLIDEAGAAVGSIRIEVPARGYLQRSDVFRAFSAAKGDSFTAVVRFDDGSEGMLAWASVVDNRSGDPVWLRAGAAAD